MTKRLFIFAAYDQDNIIDDTLIYYVSALSKIGDIIFVMDSDATKKELDKITKIPHVLYTLAIRHNEYDFGSYKRGFQYARDKKLFNKYDWIYFCNDSVYGPLWDITSLLTNLESAKADFIGLIDFESKYVPIQIQSWFFGLSKKLITKNFINTFFESVTHQENKQLIVLKYECGLTRTIVQHGFKIHSFISGENGDTQHRIYQDPISVIKDGIPFIKKTAVSNLLGLQFLYPFIATTFCDKINKNSVRCGNGIQELKKLPIPPYKKSYRLTLWSFPIITVYKQTQPSSNAISYKIKLFDFIPVFKMSFSND